MHLHTLHIPKTTTGGDPNKPNYVLTRLGLIASEGRVDRNVNFLNSVTALKVNAGPTKFDSYDYKSLKAENAALKQTIREYRLVDEAVQPSRNDELAYGLTKPLINARDSRYEIPLPFEPEKLAKLPDNCENALNRSMSLRKTALRNSTLKQTLGDTFAELISEKWIEPVKGQELKTPSCRYLLFFVTKSAKLQVVYDGSAVVDGLSLNQAVLSGENLLNNLVEVLTRFRLDKFACVAIFLNAFLG